MRRFDLKIGAIIFGFLCAGILLLQIYLSSSKMTQVETTLFGVLQFVFAVAFAWFLARSASEKEFQERQKKFAISAYRRIREISRAADRLLTRSRRDTVDMSEDLKHELVVVREISIGICDTAGSSIADWADLIGEEISTLQHIEGLRQQNVEDPDKANVGEEAGRTEQRIDGKVQVSADTAVMQTLIERLPPALRMELRDNQGRYAEYHEKFRRFRESIGNLGYVELQGFWASDAGFDRKITDLQVGDEVRIAIGDSKSRVACLLVFDQEEKKLGVVTNDRERWGDGGYIDFVQAIARAAGSSSFSATLVHIAEKPTRTGRIYFTVRVSKDSVSTK